MADRKRWIQSAVGAKTEYDGQKEVDSIRGRSENRKWRTERGVFDPR
ncbi:hypothetical protein [Pseudalkalibacillus berkeleyi]|uniref:Uncharacterized protein n=1 Tax=Pseudalkalibacillus berkeleyi TaxID=1069813 RepID=A0ABS9GXG5_9BACL|nr:hypothetical protein [Pseudalkalibacillus berkeleyi]MCF6136278.1 hypothetical protein [Pseudalkalibacillus berkeleyi]